MKYFIIVLFYLSQFVFSQDTNKSVDENFNEFIIEFSKDSAFQSDRILFPLRKIQYNLLEDKMDSLVIEKSNWQQIRFISESDNYFFTIEDDCLQENNSIKILSFVGIENGISVQYFFIKKNLNWYLKKIIDSST